MGTGSVTLSQQTLRSEFGDPTQFMFQDGSGVAREWENKILGWARLPEGLPLSWDKTKIVRRFRCHLRLVQRFESALARCHADQSAWLSLNDFGGCYQFRPNKSDPNRLSAHAWGVALDIDVLDNPRGAAPKMHPYVIQCFQNEGFVWGGLFPGHEVDGMHFEFADLSRLA